MWIKMMDVIWIEFEWASNVKHLFNGSAISFADEIADNGFVVVVVYIENILGSHNLLLHKNDDDVDDYDIDAGFQKAQRK